MRAPACRAGKSEEGEWRFGPAVAFGAGDPCHAHAKAHIVAQGQTRKERVMLKHGRDGPLGRGQPGHVLSGDQDAPLIGCHQTANDGHKRGLAASRRAKVRHVLPRSDGQRDVTQCVMRAEPVVHALQSYSCGQIRVL